MEEDDIIDDGGINNFVFDGEEDVDEETVVIEDVDISEYEVEEIITTYNLEPCMVYARCKNIKDPIGIPGFFDSENLIFMDLNGGNIAMKNFERSFNKFILKRIQQEASEDA